MSSIKTTARLAGSLYLAMGILAWFSMMYVPSVFLVRGDATATARNVVNAAALYRLGILSQLASQTIFVFLVLVLYDLFKDVDRQYARLMVTLVAISVAFEFVNCLNLVAPLILLSGADFLSVFTKAQVDALAMVFLKLRNEGLGIVSALWGLWLLPFGVLVLKSRFIPRILGVLLIVACFAYLADSVTSIVFPTRTQMVSSVTLPLGGLGELLIVLWLLTMGANTHQPEVSLA
ncbi:MAG: hypothetical protein QOK07_1807 [Gemmatimonadaceae bacterium]|jgi:hypothetical protein|nr:hypothetical protein [Gemmatimonadaceae bacterium]